MTSSTDFPQPSADALRALLDKGTAAEIVACISAVTSPLERRQLYALAQQSLSRRKEAGRDLDRLLDVVKAGIDEGVRQMAAETLPAEVARRKDFAAALAYNLAADLVECWPGDMTPRNRRQLEAGLAAARQCGLWRDELNKPVAARSLASWVRGALELSLGRAKDAASSFERALDFARRAATTAPASVVPGGDFSVILASGCLGLATKTRLFEDACAAFDAGSEGKGAEAERARAGAMQLRWFASRLADPGRAKDLAG